MGCCGGGSGCGDDSGHEMHDIHDGHGHDFHSEFTENFSAKVGYLAPDFICDGYYKGEIGKFRLSDFQDKWVVLFFYPLDFTFVCPTEIVEMSAKKEEFDLLNTQVLFVSVDSPHAHKAWSNDIGQLNFPMLSDLTHDISKDYNVYVEDEGISLRGTYIIDPDGVVQSCLINNLSVGRSSEEILRLLKAFQTGELCPSSWAPGKKTLGKAK